MSIPDGLPGRRVCVLCGETHEHSLQDHMALEDGVVSLSLAPQTRFEGFPGIMHGGYAALFMDEVLGVAIGFANGGVAITQKLELEYRRPIRLEGLIRFEARSQGHLGGHLYAGEGLVRTAAGDVLARARGEFAVTRPGVLERLIKPRAPRRGGE